MPRVCTICSHPKRNEIDAALAAGTSYRNIAEQFSVSLSAVNRHMAEHIQQSIRQSQAAKEEAGALNVVKQLIDINIMTLEVLQEARDAKEAMTALYAIDRVMKQLELQAKLIGDLDVAPPASIDWGMFTVEELAILHPIFERAEARQKPDNVATFRKRVER